MPLVVLCGYPCSGKSQRAKELEDLIQSSYPGKNVLIVSDDFSKFSKNELYGLSIHEKTARGDLKSKVRGKLQIPC